MKSSSQMRAILLARRLEAAIPPPYSCSGDESNLSCRNEPEPQSSTSGWGSVLDAKANGRRRALGRNLSAPIEIGAIYLSPMYFIYIQELCKQAAGLRQRGETEVGGNLLYSWAGRELKLSLTLTAPDGTKTVHDLERDGLGKPFVINGFDSPGLYQLTGRQSKGTERLRSIFSKMNGRWCPSME